MKHLITLAVIIGFMLSSCKTTEANYKKAYEMAKTKGESEAVDPEVYAQIYREAAPDTIVVDNVSFPGKSLYLRPVAAQGLEAGTVGKYNVAAATFKQLFNAKDMALRLRRDGYDHAFVAVDRDENYYVIAFSTLSASDAGEVLHRLNLAEHIAISNPFPYIIIRP